MIFADKLIQLRKKAGWSQEELAEQMQVSRQAVSKWEGAQSVPDLEKILRLSALFGVSTDYLLKEEIEEAENSASVEEETPLKRVSMEEANAFLAARAASAKPIAFATLLCILSPICLLLLGAISEDKSYDLPENVAAGIGLIVLLALIAIAVAIFISSGSKTAPFEYLEKEIFETEYGVSGMVKARKAQYQATYTRKNIIGTCLCILAVIPLFVGLIFDENNDLLLVAMTCILLALVGIGVMFFIHGGVVWGSYEILLQEGDYARAKKEKHMVTTAVTVAYWLIATAIYLGYSLTTHDWGYSWVIWVVAGVIFPAVRLIVDAVNRE